MSFDQIFGLTAFPADIYQTLMNHWCYQADRSPADVINGYRFMHQFPPFYMDYNAASLAIINSDSTPFLPFPEHWQRYISSTRMAPTGVAQVAAGERSRLLLESIAAMNQFHWTPPPELELTMPIARMQAPSEIMNPNVSQYHIAAQPRTLELIRKPMHNVMAWLYNYCENNDVRFSLRPLIAHRGPSQESLRAVGPLTGIPNPALHYTAAQDQMDQLLRHHLKLDKLIQHVTRSTDSPAIANHIEWQFWNDRPINAVLRWENGREMGLGPAVLIPPLYATVRDMIPVFWAEPMHIGLPGEMIHHVSFNYSEHVAAEAFIGIPRPEKYQRLADIMAAAAFYASLLSAVYVRLGRGHKRPSWTQVPLNVPIQNYWIRKIHELEAWCNGTL